VYDLKTDQVERVTLSSARELNPAWSPDGEWFAFISDYHALEGRDPHYKVYLYPTSCLAAPTSCMEVIVPIGAQSDDDKHSLGLTWSPDSQTLAFICGLNAKNGICLADIQKRAITRFFEIEDPVNIYGPNWSPDGRQIAFTGEDEEKNGFSNLDIYMLMVETGEIVNITNTPDVRESFSCWWVVRQ